jgi:hypothetical protein
MKHTLVLILCFFTIASFAQTTYFIKDDFTKDPIPFVKVKPNIGNPFLADIDGKITLGNGVTSIELRSPGYLDSTVMVEGIVNNEIFLSGILRSIQEVTVLPGVNPAHRIIDHAIENRKQNNPLSNDAFTYDSYSKFIFDLDEESLASISDSTKDTTLLQIKKFFDQQYLFMLESASTRTFIPPSRDKEEITAYKVSGFSNPMLSTFANEMQSFSFYENQFQLLGKTYINPIAFGGTKRYLFILEDTTVVNQDTTFTIFYRPRKGRNFEGMTGRLFINTNGWALEKVTASPYEDTTGIKMQIVQEYALVDNKKWFPSKLSTAISFEGLLAIANLKDGRIEGKGSTYIKNIQLNPSGLRKRDFDNVSVVTNEDAGYVKEKDWDTMRVYTITEKEKRTYTMIDSLSKAEKLEEKAMMLSSLLQGKVPLGLFNLDLTRVLDYNLYEGYRLGAGFETSKKMMRWGTFGAYYGWGTRDKQSKYGGYGTIHIYKKAGVKLFMRYQQDLLERGGYAFQKDVFTLNSTSLYRHFFIQNMERQRLAEIALSGNIRSNMKITVLGNFQRIWTTDSYAYTPIGDLTPVTSLTNFDIAETAVEFTWNIREKVMLLGNNRISKGTKFPKIMVKASKGWNGIFTSSTDYYRVNAEIQQDILVRGAGKINWTLTGGFSSGDIPLFLAQVGNGTGRTWNLSVPNTFETMTPSEFYSTKQAALFTRWNLNPFKTKAKWNEPQICFHHAIGVGTMDASVKNQHNVAFKTMEKGFFEGGLVLNNVLTSGASGVGIGLFYRYGNYASPHVIDNLLPKITVSFNL